MRPARRALSKRSPKRPKPTASKQPSLPTALIEGRRITAVHLACGKRHIPGFIHVDLADWPHIDHRHDIRTLPMFKDGTVDLVYCAGALPYFDRFEVVEILKEWMRVLKPGGTLRVSVPDFEAVAEVYLKDRKIEQTFGPLYGRWPIKGTDQCVYLRTVYDWPFLKQTLEEVGFAKVRKYDWRKTVHKDHDDYSQAYLPHMDKDHGRLMALNVEATKP